MSLEVTLLNPRYYELSIQPKGREAVITPPFRVQFNITKSISGNGLNKLGCSVYGLKESTRALFRKDAEDNKVMLPMALSVGYTNALVRIFTGNLHRGNTKLTKEGFVTSFEAYDGGFDYLSSFTSKTINTGEDIVDSLLEDMPNTKKGRITSLPAGTRPRVVFGSTSKLLQGAANGAKFYINDGKINMIKDKEAIKSFIPKLTPSSLLSTPTREFLKVTCDTVMNPYLVPGGLFDLESKVDPLVNGVYRADTITYKGDNEGNDWKQSISGFLAHGYTVV